MSSETPKPPEGFTKAAAPADDNDDEYDTEQVDKPELGELLQGTLLAVKPDRGRYNNTVLEFKLSEPYGEFDQGDLVWAWSTSKIDELLEAADAARGDEVAIATEDTWETDDGETRNIYSVYTEGDN